MAGLEWFVTELLTNERVQCGPSLVVDGRPARQLVKDGPLVTGEHVAIIHELEERAWEAMQRGAGASELRPLALRCLETLWGPRWHEQLGSPDLDQGLPPT